MTIFFDFAIFLILFFSAYWMFIIVRTFLNPNFEKPKTKLVRIGILAVLAIIFFTVLYGSFIEPRKLVVTTRNINLGTTATTENIRIVFLTDIHVGKYKKDQYINKIVDRVITIKPDLIIFGGDYILGQEREATHLAPLGRLRSLYPMYAVTGNHEYNQGHYGDPHYQDKTASIRKLFADWGIKFLDNENEIVTIKGSSFNLTGIEDIWTKKADLPKAMATIDEKLPKILLSHNPDIILDPLSKKFNLILSGHTHAGQIRLPYIGSLAPIPDQIGRKYDYGLFDLGGNYLVISAGLGESGVRARLFDPPEIVLLNIDL